MATYVLPRNPIKTNRTSLIVGLLEIDVWFSNYFSTRPQARTDLLTIFTPSDYTLYSARSASRWVQLGGFKAINVHPVAGSPILSCSRAVHNSDSLHSLLHVFHLHVHDAHCRMKARQSRESQNVVLEPWIIYEQVAQDMWLVNAPSLMFTAAMTLTTPPTPQCLIMWHSACLSLTANSQLLELALRPKGLRSSMSAMNQVALWTRTPTARRACLHAGEIFNIIWHRRTSDVVNLHTALSLFRAALVFGLYVLNHTHELSRDAYDPLELLDSFGWDEIGNSGIGGQISSQIGDNNSSHAKIFIEQGGEFCISGEVYTSGYPNARRVLLHFADLMENLGKWKSRRFSRILHIISEDLTEYDRKDEEESDHTPMEML